MKNDELIIVLESYFKKTNQLLDEVKNDISDFNDIIFNIDELCNEISNYTNSDYNSAITDYYHDLMLSLRKVKDYITTIKSKDDSENFFFYSLYFRRDNDYMKKALQKIQFIKMGLEKGYQIADDYNNTKLNKINFLMEIETMNPRIVSVEYQASLLGIDKYELKELKIKLRESKASVQHSNNAVPDFKHETYDIDLAIQNLFLISRSKNEYYTLFHSYIEYCIEQQIPCV
jgi:hypothetical protein